MRRKQVVRNQCSKPIWVYSNLTFTSCEDGFDGGVNEIHIWREICLKLHPFYSQTVAGRKYHEFWSVIHKQAHLSKESTSLLWYFDELHDEILSEREFRLIPVKRLQHLDLVRLWEFSRNGHTSCIILSCCFFSKLACVWNSQKDTSSNPPFSVIPYVTDRGRLRPMRGALSLSKSPLLSKRPT